LKIEKGKLKITHEKDTCSFTIFHLQFSIDHSALSSPKCSFRRSFMIDFPMMELMAPPMMNPTMTRLRARCRFGFPSQPFLENGHMVGV